MRFTILFLIILQSTMLFIPLSLTNEFQNNTMCSIASQINWRDWKCDVLFYCDWDGVTCNEMEEVVKM